MATYYVKTGGSDSNTGLDDANAWAHHPWMSTWTGSVTLAAGDTVCMNKGNTWTIASPVAAYMTVGQSGSVGNYITTTSYGTGVKPIINISTETEYQVIEAVTKSFLVFDNLDISHWDEAQDIGAIGGFTAITLGTTCHDVLITNCDIHNCPSFGISVGVDGYNITVGDISATTTATTVSYSNHIYDIGYSAISMSGCDPSTEISNYKVYYNYIHDVYAEGTDGSNAYGVSFSSAVSATNATNYTYVKYNYIKDIPAWTGVDNHNGLNAYIQDNYISNCKYGYSSQITTPGGSWSGVLTNLYLERNTFENSTDH